MPSAAWVRHRRRFGNTRSHLELRACRSVLSYPNYDALRSSRSAIHILITDWRVTPRC